MRHDRLPLVLVPGLLCTARLWRDQVEDLSDVAIPMVTAQHVRFDDVEDIAAAVLAEAPQEFALAGLSFGGYVAMAIARRAPERLLGLALVDTTARPDSEQRKVQRAEVIRQSGQGRLIGVAARLDKPFTETQLAKVLGELLLARPAIHQAIDTRKISVS